MDTLSGGTIVTRSAEKGLWQEGEAWTLVEELRIGSRDGEGPETFGDVAGVAVDGGGALYVVDALAKELKAFSADGAHLWTAGREGEGPGEFLRPVGVAVDDRGTIWVVDRRRRRYVAFDRTGDAVGEVARRGGGPFGIWRGRFDVRGRLVDPSLVTIEPGLLGDGVVRTDAELRATDSLSLSGLDRPTFEPVRGGGVSFAVAVPFAPHTVWVPAASGGMWMATTEPYVVSLVDFDGDTLRVLERRVEPLPLSRSDEIYADSVVRDLREAGGRPDPSRIPSVKPRLRWLEPATDGHLWVRVHRPDGAPAYDVFDPDGRYLGEVASPVDLEEGLAFTATAIVGILEDDLGVPYVVRLRIEKGDDLATGPLMRE